MKSLLFFSLAIFTGVSSYGTLITIFPTQKGVLICADKRLWNRLETKDDVEKIHFLNSRGVYAVSGEEAISTFQDGKLITQYTVEGSVDKFFAQNAKLNPTSIQNFCKAFGQEFTDAHNRYNDKLELLNGATDDVVTEIDFVYLSEENANEIISNRLEYHITGECSVEDFSNKQSVTGETGVLFKILRRTGDDYRFSDLWGNPKFATVWLQGTPYFPSKPSVDDSLYVAHMLIQATHERSNLISSGPNLVGPTCDCALVEPKSGAKWIEKAFDTEKKH